MYIFLLYNKYFMLKRILFLSIFILIWLSFNITNANQTIYRFFDWYEQFNINEIKQNNKIEQIKRFDVLFVKNFDDIKDLVKRKNINLYSLILVKNKEKFENNLRENIYIENKNDFFIDVKSSAFYQDFKSLSSYENEKGYLYVCWNSTINEWTNTTSRYFCWNWVEINFDNYWNIVSNEEYSKVVNNNSLNEIQQLDNQRKYLKVTYEKIKNWQKFYKDKKFEDFEQHIIELTRKWERWTNLLKKLWELDYNNREIIKLNWLKKYSINFAQIEIDKINETNSRTKEEQKAYEDEAIANYSSLKKKYEQLQNQNSKLKEQLMKYKNNSADNNSIKIVDNKNSSIINSKWDIIVKKLLEIIDSKTQSLEEKNILLEKYSNIINKSTKIDTELKNYIVSKLNNLVNN